MTCESGGCFVPVKSVGRRWPEARAIALRLRPKPQRPDEVEGISVGHSIGRQSAGVVTT